ncbi:MAG: VanZ family protein [Gaiellaceae bacterium]
MALPRAVSLWLPVVAWAGLIFTLSSIPDLGTGLGGWDLVLRKAAHAAEFAVLGFLLLRAIGREALSLVLGIAYALTDELHQHFVPGRQASLLDVLLDAVGVALGVYAVRGMSQRRNPPRGLTPPRTLDRPASRRSSSKTGSDPAPEGARKRHRSRPVAIDLDGALGDTHGLWRDWLDDAARRFRSIAPLEPDTLPEDRADAAAALDTWAENGVGDWRGALERFAEDHAPVYLRPDADATASLRALAASGRRIGVFTDAPEPLARVALAHLGASRRIEALETGEAALERLREQLGGDVEVIRSPDDLLRASA